MRARASGPVSRRSSMRRVITFNGWLRIGVVMMQRCYNAVFRYIFLSMTFLTCWQIFPDYAAPPCIVRHYGKCRFTCRQHQCSPVLVQHRRAVRGAGVRPESPAACCMSVSSVAQMMESVTDTWYDSMESATDSTHVSACEAHGTRVDFTGGYTKSRSSA